MLGSVPHLSCALVVPVGLCAPPSILPVAHLCFVFLVPAMPWWLSAEHGYYKTYNGNTWTVVCTTLPWLDGQKASAHYVDTEGCSLLQHYLRLVGTLLIQLSSEAARHARVGTPGIALNPLQLVSCSQLQLCVDFFCQLRARLETSGPRVRLHCSRHGFCQEVGLHERCSHMLLALYPEHRTGPLARETQRLQTAGVRHDCCLPVGCVARIATQACPTMRGPRPFARPFLLDHLDGIRVNRTQGWACGFPRRPK